MARSSQDKEIIVRDNGYLAKYCAWHTPTITAFGRKGQEDGEFESSGPAWIT